MVKIVYDTLKNDWVFEDFPSFTLAARPQQGLSRRLFMGDAT
jgi:hypothetical protein